MELILTAIFTFLFGLTILLFSVGKDWNKTFLSFLFADRTLKVGSASLAITSHWFWAIAIFVGPAVAYNWGIIGLLWFVVPNALSLLVAGFIIYNIRDRYPNGFSLTGYVKNNFSKRVGILYQVEFLLVSFAALLLAFTAIGKFWAFTGLTNILPAIYANLLVGIITLIFTMRGGIRTSILTGSIQTILWLVLLFIAYIALFILDRNFVSYGKNNLTTVLDIKFLTTFAIAWLISIIVGATSHGMMWQKGFSMTKENILPSFSIAAVIFGVITFMMGGLGLYAYTNTLDVKIVDTSQMISLISILGSWALIAFATILVGQTSTVIDSALNYVSSLVSMEWIKKEDVTISRTIMLIFILTAWLVSWLQLEIWTILMLMGCVRIAMFVPVALHSINFNINEQGVFYASIVAILGSFCLSYIARIEKLPIFDMYSVLFAFFLPLITHLVINKTSLNSNK